MHWKILVVFVHTSTHWPVLLLLLRRHSAPPPRSSDSGEHAERSRYDDTGGRLISYGTFKQDDRGVLVPPRKRIIPGLQKGVLFTFCRGHLHRTSVATRRASEVLDWSAAKRPNRSH